MDSVEIRGLSCRCIIGIRPRERRVEQRVRLDLDLCVDLSRAGKSGRIAHTIDYSRVSTELIALLKFRRYSLLELAAEECVGWLFATYPSVSRVRIGIAKPQALAGQADSGGVRIHRDRPSPGVSEPTEFGFRKPQLDTSDASIALIGLDPGARLKPSDLRAERVLVMPLSGKLQAERALLAHEPAVLAPAGCLNPDALAALMVVCVHRTPHV
jgi:dihydroneopterin aldolase